MWIGSMIKTIVVLPLDIVFVVVGGVISLGNEKQKSIVLSSTKSKYMALSNATTKVV